MEYEPGARIENLEIERELGRGAFGVVYLARDRLLGRPVALKVLLGGDVEVPLELRGQVLAEARIIAGLRSPHIVTLFRLHETADGGFLQEMELVGGGSLEDRLSPGEPMELGEAVRVFRGLCDALRTAHAARIIHGDIKPANVLFGAGDVVKLADFGVARLLEGAGKEIALEGRVFGSPLYMAPEVITGRAAGLASDLWSMGVLAYLLLAGRLPFEAETLNELLPKLLRADPDPLPAGVPPALAAVVLGLLAKDAAARPASAEDVLDSVGQAVPRAGRAERPTNIPPASRALVGREREAADIAQLLASEHVRLVTITGPPGVGKTRLATEMGYRLFERFEGGTWYANLETASDREDVERLLAAVLGSGDVRYRKPLLVVLDGIEHLSRVTADLVGGWGKRFAHVRCIAASRELLRIAGEHVVELGPLDEDAAIELYRESSGDGNPVPVVRDLECMPLGIVAAASGGVARGREALAQSVERSFLLLRDWEKAAFLRACDFADGLTLDEAEAEIDLDGFDDAPLALDALQSLRERSLLLLRDDRFVLPGFVRGYGRRLQG